MSNSTSEYLISPDLLTIIITTSPVPSSPSPDLIKNTIGSLPDSLSKVPIVISFDNFTIDPDECEKLKKGYISKDLANRYPAYIENVCNLFGDVSCLSDRQDCFVSTSLNRDVTFLILKQRHGFAFSIKIALDYVKTPYIMILQHDWLFAFHPPISHLLSILQTEDEVQYIGFIARMSLNYETSKGHSHLYYRYIFSQARNLRLHRSLNNDLIACLHWFDRPHLCSVETYRQIFAMSIMKRGDFLEDTFGTEYIKNMTNASTKEAALEQWQKWGAWLYYPNNGETVTVRHQHGRLNLLGEREKEKINNIIKSNLEKRANLTSEEKKIWWKENDLSDDFSVVFE